MLRAFVTTENPLQNQEAAHAENRRLHVDYHALARAAEAELAKAVAASSSASETTRWVRAFNLYVNLSHAWFLNYG